MQQCRKIGLIGGLAFRAGIFYYDQIVQRFAAIKQPLRLVLAHADIAKVLSCISNDDKPELGRYLASLGNELFDAGAELVAVTAVAPHLAIGEIAQLARGPLVQVAVKLPRSLVEEIHSVYGSIALNGKRGTEAETRFLAEAARQLILTAIVPRRSCLPGQICHPSMLNNRPPFPT